MKAIAINGSPRKGGNTQILLEKICETLVAAGWETELIQIGGKTIKGCSACYQCFESPEALCAMKDDIFNECFEKMLAAQAIICGSPTYFTDVSAEMKALLDRAGFVSVAKGGLLRGKIGAAVIAVRRGGGTHAFDSINHMFLMSGMIVPGSTYWNLGYGLNRGDVAHDAEGLRNMTDLGNIIGWLGNAISSSQGTFPKAPVAEG